jgi:hypothetical protein
MKRAVFVFAALLLPQVALAGGVGFTGSVGGGGGLASLFSATGGGAYPHLQSGYPTLDYHSDKHLIQLDLLGLISSITISDNIGVAANYYYQTYRGKVTEELRGTVAPGLGIGYYGVSGSTSVDGIVNLRMGVQTAKEMGVGLYVVPGIGVGSYADELELVLGGSVQLSVWMTGGGD